MIDRRHAPPFREIAHLVMPAPEVRHLSHGVPLYCIPGSSQELVKLEVLFLVGRVHEDQPLAARATGRLIREGTSGLDGATIADLTDFYGGSISTTDSMDHTGLTLHCLSRFFSDLLPVFSALILEPSFPEKEFQLFIRNNQQRLSEDLAKNEVVAYREMTALIFGADHPYGWNSFPDTYAALKRSDVQSFWTKHFVRGNALLIISGQYDEAMIQQLDDQICKHLRSGRSETVFPAPAPPQQRILRVQERDSLQNAVRIGRLLFDRNHPDYYPMHAVNLLLGGYFGSRLMTQIREELGLTYNIYSHIDAMRHSGYFYISAEVSKEETQRTLDEIRKEIIRLREEPVEAEELLMMQRFAAGNLLHLLDGPFNRADTLKNLLIEGGTFDDFNQLVQAIRKLTPRDVQELATRWLDPDLLIEVVIG
ncbi:MAG: insulinase family protein [Saprospiraceae bacterium]|nr:insulinase family protein [Saprospiraceae bacterium]